jgi:hypothetical protein
MKSGTKLIKVDAPLKIVEEVMVRFSESVPMGDKWKGGKLILKYSRYDLANKEIPIDAFFL